MHITFSDIAIGSIFHTGKTRGIGNRAEVEMYIKLQKIDKSTARVIEQIGFNNKRQVGDIRKFSAQTRVFYV